MTTRRAIRRSASLNSNVGTFIAIFALLINGAQSFIIYGQLNAAKVQIQEGREQERRQFRAYIGTEAVNVTYFDPSSRILQLEYFYKNFGQSKAKAYSYRGFIEEMPENPDRHYQVQDDFDLPVNNENETPPGKTQSFTLTKTLSPPGAKDPKSSNNIYVFYGRIDYSDVFDIRRRKRFCVYYYAIDIEDAGSISDVTNINWGYCANHNDAD